MDEVRRKEPRRACEGVEADPFTLVDHEGLRPVGGRRVEEVGQDVGAVPPSADMAAADVERAHLEQLTRRRQLGVRLGQADGGPPLPSVKTRVRHVDP